MLSGGINQWMKEKMKNEQNNRHIHLLGSQLIDETDKRKIASAHNMSEKNVKVEEIK